MSNSPDKRPTFPDYGDYDADLVGNYNSDNSDCEDPDLLPDSEDEIISEFACSDSECGCHSVDFEESGNDSGSESDEEDDELEFATINAFSFCKKHGNEFCKKCLVDFRIFNKDRPAIRDVFKLTRAHKKHEKGRLTLYECSCDRGSTDCPDCFNWPKYIKDEAVRAKGDVGNRLQLLRLLESVGVWLSPQGTGRWEITLLEKKLSNFLETAQRLTSIAPKTINPSKLAQWQDTKKAVNAMDTRAWRQSDDDETGTEDSAFNDLCSTVVELAKYHEMGHKSFFVCDEDHRRASILGIHRLDDKTPLVSLVYQDAIFNEPTGVWNIGGFTQNMAKGGNVVETRASLHEQALLKKLLADNAKLLSSEYKPQKQNIESSFTPSFVVPVHWPSDAEVQTLELDAGCAVCGKPTTTRCSQCRLVWYCGQACQKSDWAQHKERCKYMKAATWASVRISTSVVINGERRKIGYIRHHDQTIEQRLQVVDADGPPPNIYGEKPFVIKLQRQLKADEVDRELPGNVTIDEDGPKCMLVYDDRLTIRGHVLESENAEVYKKMFDEMLAGENMQKMYRWAIRVGDYQLKVCLDRDPYFGEKEECW
ncbi:hypothetical protein BDZ89DRAFT_1169257, partial [Hymenopellis radicata]